MDLLINDSTDYLAIFCQQSNANLRAMPDAIAWTPDMWNKDTHWIQQDPSSEDGLFIDATGGRTE